MLKRHKYILLLLLVLLCTGCSTWREGSGQRESLSGEPFSSLQEASEQAAEIPEYAEEASESFYYAYSTLEESEERQLYQELLESLLDCRGETELSTLDEALVEPVFACVMADHPEIFYVDGYNLTSYRMGDEVKKLTFSGTLTMETAEIELRRAQIERASEEWLAGARNLENSYEKLKYLYEYLISHTDYELGCSDSQNICSVLLNGVSVCQGYAKTLQYLCQQLEIPALLVSGTVRGQGHAWNLVYMDDGQWYYVDPTWGDASYQQADGTAYTENSCPAVNYDYFCVTTQQLKLTHSPDEKILLPECTALSCSYYRREGLYLESAEESAIAGIFEQADRLGTETVTFQCADDAVYEAVYRLLIEEQKIFDYLDSAKNTVAYSDRADRRTFSFWLQ